MTVHPVAALVLASMRSRLGQMENPANSNNHPTVKWYNTSVTYLAPTWNYCAAGVTRAFYDTAAKPLIRSRAYVPWMMQDFLNGHAGAKLIWIDSSTAAARPGDVVFFDWSKPTDGRKSVWTGNHVGIIESVKDGDEFITLEHNTSVPGTGNEGVARKVRNTKYVVAIGRPAWATIPTPPVARALVPYPGHVHHIDSRDDHHVEQIQKRLRQYGLYSGPIDEKFGPMTKTAVLRFQKSAGLSQDGKVGPKTWAALKIYNR